MKNTYAEMDRTRHDLLASAQAEHGPASDSAVWRRWGSGPAMVLLHGSGGSWTHWARNIAELSRSHTVLVPDLPGHGASRDMGDRSYIALGRRLAVDIDHIVRGAPYVLVGFSFGSLVAEAIALLCPERVRRLVLIRGTFTGIAPPFPAGLRNWKNLSPELEHAAHLHNLGVLMLHDPMHIDEEAVEIHASNTRHARVRPADFSWEGLENSLERLVVPLTAVRGEFDALGGDADAQREVLKARCPSAIFHSVPNAGHWVAYEASESINKILSAPGQTPHDVSVS